MPARALRSLRSVFAGFVAVGIAVILAFTSFRSPTAGQSRHWIMIALVVAIMLAYGIVIWLRSRTQYASDTDGETFYYLGFIYTLVTLVVTFAPLLDSADKQPDTRRVLGLFGLGLITTFVGLAGRVFFSQLGPQASLGPEEGATRLADAYAEAARAIEASTLRIVQAQQRVDGQLSDAYSAAIEAIHAVADRITQEYAARSNQTVTQFGAAIERVALQGETAFAELRTRTERETEDAARQIERTHQLLRGQIDTLITRSTDAIRGLTEQATHDFARIATGFATQLTEFLGGVNTNVSSTLQVLEARLLSLRLPPEELGQKLEAILKALVERGESLRQSIPTVAAAYTQLEGVLVKTVTATTDAGKALIALTASTTGATTALGAAKANAGEFAAQLGAIGQLSTFLQKLPQESEKIVSAVTALRERISETDAAWRELAQVTKSAVRAVSTAEGALATFETGTRAAQRSVLNWSSGVTKATADLHALTDIARQADELGREMIGTHQKLSDQVSGPLAEELRTHSEAAHALSERLQNDLRASEEAVRRVHQELIDASRFILDRINRDSA